MKRSKRILSILSISCLSLLPLSVLSCEKNDSITINTNILENKEEGTKKINELIDNDNKFINDIAKYANDDSILFYNISYIAVAHKYIPLAHLLNVLQLNPQKEIYLFCNTNRFNPKIDEMIQSNNYPNFHYIKYNDDGIDIEGDFEYGYNAIKEFERIIKENNIDINKIVLQTDEFFFFQRLQSLINGNLNNVDGFVNDYSLFYKIREINMIADGTISAKFFNNSFFDYFVNNQKLFELVNNKYENAINTIKNIRLFDKEQFIKFINENNFDLATLLFYLIISSKNNVNDTSITQVNFFVPALEMILDVNNTSSTILSNNDKYDLFYNPYNTYNLNFITLLSNLKDKQYNFFFNAIGITNEQLGEIDSYKQLFNNHYNIVYSGSKVVNGNINNLENEARTLISIYFENYDNKDKLRIWFKGHPRDGEEYSTLIKQKIKSMGFPEIANSIFFFNKLIPMEALVSRDFMKTDLTKKRVVKNYGSFSTIYLYFFANKIQNDLSRIIIKKTDEKIINEYFGNAIDSIIFNKEKKVEVNEFYEMYSFLTKINTNKNYVIFDENNNGIINWDTFEQYEKWQLYSRLTYQITITINQKEYIYKHINPNPNYDSGLVFVEKEGIKVMFDENKQFAKSYLISKYMNDVIANETMDFDINLQKENRKYLIASIKIEYLNNENKYQLFSNINNFVLLKDY